MVQPTLIKSSQNLCWEKISSIDDLPEELEELDQMVVKQLKNRYNDPTVFKRFVIGVDRSRMKLYDCEQEAQEELIENAESSYDDSIPVADRGRSSKFGDFKM